MSNETSRKEHETLDRQGLLEALDYEIAKQEREDNRLGITYWGLVVTFFVLNWLVIEHSLDPEKHFRWPHVALIFLAVQQLLSRLYFFFHGLSTADLEDQRRSDATRLRNMQQFLADGGTSVPRFYVMAAEILVRLGVAVYLVFAGYLLLGFVQASFEVLLLVFFVVGVIAVRVKVPLIRSDDARPNEEHKITKILRLLLYCGVYVGIALPFFYLIREWDSIGAHDWKQGLLFAAIFQLGDLISMRAPTSKTLRKLEVIRSKLAFGWISIDTAKVEVDELILGVTPEGYVRKKVQEICALVLRHAELARSAKKHIQHVLNLNSNFDECADEEQFKRKHRREIADARKHIHSIMNRIPDDEKRIDILFQTLVAREEVVRKFHGVPATKIAEISAPIDAAFQERSNALGEITDVYQDFCDAHNAMFVSANPDEEIGSFRQFLKLIKRADP